MTASDSVVVPVTQPAPGAGPTATAARYARFKLLLLFLVCAAPVVASYLVYYVFPPAGRTHYGTLIAPQRPMPAALGSHAEGGAALRGKWLLVQADSGHCEAACVAKLYALRQQRTMTGKDRERVERLWLLTDQAMPRAELERDYAGTVRVPVATADLEAWLPVEPGRSWQDYLYLVDPLGHLMMRFPADGDPAKIRKDLARLLRASRIG